MKIREWLEDQYGHLFPESPVVLEGLDACVIGVAENNDIETRVVYDRGLVVAHFMALNGWDLETAEEWVDYNVAAIPGPLWFTAAPKE